MSNIHNYVYICYACISIHIIVDAMTIRTRAYGSRPNVRRICRWSRVSFLIRVNYLLEKYVFTGYRHVHYWYVNQIQSSKTRSPHQNLSSSYRPPSKPVNVSAVITKYRTCQSDYFIRLFYMYLYIYTGNVQCRRLEYHLSTILEIKQCA